MVASKPVGSPTGAELPGSRTSGHCLYKAETNGDRTRFFRNGRKNWSAGPPALLVEIGDVPEFDGPVVSGRGDQPPVRAECQAVHPIRVPTERRQFAAVGHPPEADGPVVPGGGEQPAIGAE